MGLNDTASGNRVHIALFGKRNAGKSSIINAITNQNVSVVSHIPGTTTDPVYRAMELLPLGPVMMVDTAGIDDDQENLGNLRMEKTRQVLRKTDLALLVIDASVGFTSIEQEWIALFQKQNIPFLTVYNKTDLVAAPSGELAVSTVTGEGIDELKQAIIGKKKPSEPPSLVSRLVKKGDVAVLVTPIDSSAPKGRIILPQQQTIRALLDADVSVLVVKETMLQDAMKQCKESPDIVITDSQVFDYVEKSIKRDIPLTSFSILLARQKGDLDFLVSSVKSLDKIKNGDKILIAEGCTHHRQCEDIGTVKLPGWIRKYTQAEPEFVFVSGTEFPEDISEFRLIVHCGGCMLRPKEMQYRQEQARQHGIPMTNYGVAIAYMKGILQRSLEPFPDLYRHLSGESDT